MNSSEIMTEQDDDGRKTLEKAAFLNRILAKAIDFLIVVALLEIIPKAGFWAGIAYILIADGLFQGRSIGKKLTGLRVVLYTDSFHMDCGYKESVIRNSPLAAGYFLSGILSVVPLLGWILSFAVLALILIFETLVMFGSEDGMRLGDEIAKTQVVADKEGDVNVS